MSECDYSSGPWTGFYNYARGAFPQPMDLFLNFSGGKITGHGHDPVGGFVIAGGYDGGGRCHWTKIYPGSHEVSYSGFREGKGIWGTWKMQRWGSGGFHIWPLDAGGAEEEAEQFAEQELPVEIVLVGQPGRSASPLHHFPARISRRTVHTSCVRHAGDGNCASQIEAMKRW